MPRFARAVVSDSPHHITQRGNNREDVFFVADDYEFYLLTLREQSARYGLDVHAYCLMPNHVHLVATAHAADSLAKAVGRTHWLYSQAINPGPCQAPSLTSPPDLASFLPPRGAPEIGQEVRIDLMA